MLADQPGGDRPDPDEPRADLHSHSSASDGTRLPAEVVRRAHAARVSVLALTDHDTVAGINEAVGALPPGMSLVPGMELSCRRNGRSVHLLAYLFSPDHPELTEQLRRIRESRVDRARAMIARLAELGVPVTWEQVADVARDGVVGRPHIARAMVDAGVIESVQDAFTAEWLAPGGRAHVRRYAPDPAEAIALVRAAGGVSVLAHPLADSRGAVIADELITELARAGLAGLEVAHPNHTDFQRVRLRTLASKLGLAATGGSDDHGEITNDRIGCESTNTADLELLLAPATGAKVIRR